MGSIEGTSEIFESGAVSLMYLGGMHADDKASPAWGDIGACAVHGCAEFGKSRRTHLMLGGVGSGQCSR